MSLQFFCNKIVLCNKCFNSTSNLSKCLSGFLKISNQKKNINVKYDRGPLDHITHLKTSPQQKS